MTTPQTTHERIQRHVRDLFEDAQTAGLTLLDFEELVRKLIVKAALEDTDWNICAAARLVGMHRNGFSSRMKRHGLKRPEDLSKPLCRCGRRISPSYWSRHMEHHARRGDLQIVHPLQSKPRYKWLRDPAQAVA